MKKSNKLQNFIAVLNNKWFNIKLLQMLCYICTITIGLIIIFSNNEFTILKIIPTGFLLIALVLEIIASIISKYKS